MSETPRRTIRPLNELVVGTSDIRLAARRLRWFVASFRRQIEILSEDSGIVFDLDERKLARVFVSWLRRFEMIRANAALNRRDVTHYAAGLMLRELIVCSPLMAMRLPEGCDKRRPVCYWPEGFAYLTYCMTVCEAVLTQEFDIHIEPDADIEDIAVWWSFRENMIEDDRWAIPFFDKFSGHEANWDAPGLFFARRLIQKGLNERRDAMGELGQTESLAMSRQPRDG